MRKALILAAVVALAVCLAIPLADEGQQVSGAAEEAQYSEDGSTLLRVPSSEGDRFTVAPGTVCIGDRAFEGNGAIQFVQMPDSVTEIGDYAFHRCVSLIDPGMSDSVRTIGDHAFEDTPVRLDTLPESLETVGEHAFDGCSHIESLEFPDSVRKVGDHAFSGSGITHLVLNQGLEEIGVSAFGGIMCGFLEVPSSVKKVGQVFTDVNAVRFNGTPEGIEKALYGSFYTGCDPSVLEARYTPGLAYSDGLVYGVYGGAAAVVSYIPDEVGANRVAEKITIEGKEYDVLSAAPSAFAGSPFEYLHAAEDVDRGAVPDSRMQKALVIPGSVRTLGEGCFALSSLVEVTVPETVKLVSENAFVDCDRLVSADIGAKVVGPTAFSSCDKLEDVRFRGSVDTISMGAFMHCALKEIDLVDVRYGENVFGDNRFEVLNIGEGVKDLSMLDLGYSDGLKKITLDPLNRNFSLKDGVLYSADGSELLLYSVEAGNVYDVPEGTVSIGPCAFFMSDATQVTLPESLERIGDMAFCLSGVDSITVPSGVTEIDGQPFFLMTIKAECDPSLIDWDDNFPAESVKSEGCFLYTERYGCAMITGVSDGFPKDLRIPATLSCDGRDLPVMLGSFSLADISLDSLSFESEIGMQDAALAGSTVKVFHADGWMDAEKLFILLEGCSVGSYASDSEGYRAEDGVLFAGDSLIRFPSLREGQYSVPEGITDIAENAFEDSRLDRLEFPQSVSVVGYHALTGMEGVTVFFGNGETSAKSALAHSDDPSDYRIVSPYFIGDLGSCPQGHMIVYSSVDAPSGFVLPDDQFVPYGEEAVPTVPVVDGYITYALVGSEEWQPETHYMGITDLGVCFVFEADQQMSGGSTVVLLMISMAAIGLVVVAFVLNSSRKSGNQRE